MFNVYYFKICYFICKFDYKMVGPFCVLNIIFPTVVWFNFLKKWRIYNSFYISFLKPYRTGL